MSDTRTIRIGSGAGFAGDRVTPAVELSEDPDFDYLGFECLAERTIALAQREKLADPNAGYNPRMEERFRAVLKNCVENDITRLLSHYGRDVRKAVSEVDDERARSRVDDLGLVGPNEEFVVCAFDLNVIGVDPRPPLIKYGHSEDSPDEGKKLSETPTSRQSTGSGRRDVRPSREVNRAIRGFERSDPADYNV